MSVVSKSVSGEQKEKFKLEIESLIQKRDAEIEDTLRSEIQLKERILVTELAKDDSYTKRARPTVVYAGLVFIAFNYVIVPIVSDMLGQKMGPFELPTEFWYGWSGIVATWTVGRSFEKKGVSNQLTQKITGNRQVSSLLDDDKAFGGYRNYKPPI